MEWTVRTSYDLPALKAMAKALRKTVRRKRSKRSHIFGMLVILLGLILILSASEWNFKHTLTAAVVAMIAAALIWEDTLNGYLAWKRGIPGLKSALVTFREDGYHSVTEVGESEFSYGIIMRLAQSGDYLVFVIGPSHGQVYDLRKLQGDREKFKEFLMEKTGLPLESV